MTRASLIVPSYRGAKRLPTLLKALAQQSHGDWEAIVVIDGVYDESEQIVERFATHLPVRALALPQNVGRVGALNVGFAAAMGDVLIRCDDDFEPSPEHVSAHVAAHACGPCGAVGLPLNIAPPNAYMRVYGEHADINGRQESYALPAQERWRIWGGNTSVSREVYETVGDFDARYRGYGWEDIDFGYRIDQAGFPIVLVPDADVRHHMASVTTQIRADRAFRSGHARRTFEMLHGIGSSGPAPADAPSTLWGNLVSRTSDHLTLARTRHLARAIDTVLPMTPTPVGRKLVALTVEAAAAAGFADRSLDVG